VTGKTDRVPGWYIVRLEHWNGTYNTRIHGSVPPSVVVVVVAAAGVVVAAAAAVCVMRKSLPAPPDGRSGAFEKGKTHRNCRKTNSKSLVIHPATQLIVLIELILY
jgi:hypothetical protein